MDSFRPLVRFAGFEGEWERVRLGEMFDRLKHNSLSRAELCDEGEIANIHYGDVLIHYGECIDTTKDNLTYIKDKKLGNSLLQVGALRKGDVIFADAAEDNTVGKCSELICNESEQIVSGLHTIACRPLFPFAERYLGYCLNSPSYHNQLLPLIQGTKVSSISFKSLSQTLLLYPHDYKEQQAIANYFTKLDEELTLQTQKLSKLKQIKAASLQNMFPHEGETVPLVRFSGFGGEWEKVRLGDMFDIGNGYTPSKNVPQFWTNGTIPWFRMEDIRENGRILKDSIQHVTKEAVKSTGLFPANSIIISTTATIGEHALLIADSLANQQFSFLVRKLNRIDSMDIMFIFYHCFLLGDWCRSKSNAGGLLAVNMEDLRNYYFSLPSLPEQQKISEYFTKLDRKIELETQKLEKLKQIKSACLSKMFV